ncbi:HAD family hydrolase [Candidatus Saccharibacteria bacterium]|nr:HAD family hydrolase [Candidatus Saccharibacteria bacterium]
MTKEAYIPHNTKVIAFDWDMTLVDSHGKILQNQAIAHEFGNQLSIDEVRQLWNDSTGFVDLMARLTNGAAFDEVMAVVKRDYNKPDYAKRSFDFVQPTVKQVRAMGYKTAIISGVQRELLDQDAQNLSIPIHTLFDFVQAQDDCEFKKPDPRVFDPILEHFGIAANNLLYIGDEEKDYHVAASAGAHFIGVETGMSTAQEFDTLGAIHTKTIQGVTKHGHI